VKKRSILVRAFKNL